MDKTVYRVYDWLYMISGAESSSIYYEANSLANAEKEAPNDKKHVIVKVEVVDNEETLHTIVKMVG